MSDQINEHISAFLDDELSPEECTFLVRRFERDPALRGQLLRYAVIGSALREEAPGSNSGELVLRVRAALSGREPHAALPAARARGRTFVRPLFGVGLAASVALTAIFGLRFVNQFQAGADIVAPGIAETVEWTEPASYIVPQDVSGPRLAAPPIRLTNYLMQHGNYTTTLHRTAVHSNVVAIGESGSPADEGSAAEAP